MLSLLWQTQEKSKENALSIETPCTWRFEFIDMIVAAGASILADCTIFMSFDVDESSCHLGDVTLFLIGSHRRKSHSDDHI